VTRLLGSVFLFLIAQQLAAQGHNPNSHTIPASDQALRARATMIEPKLSSPTVAAKSNAPFDISRVRTIAPVPSGSEIVDQISIPADALRGPTKTSASGLSFGGTAEPKPVQITIAGQSLLLLPVEEWFDRESVLRHVSAVSITDTSAVARFTIDTEGNLVGTVTLKDRTLRIAQFDRESQLVVSKPLPRSEQILVAERWQRPTTSALEKEHERTLVLARLQPWNVQFSTRAQSTLMQGGALGALRSESATDVVAALSNLNLLTRATNSTQVRVTAVNQSAAGRLIEFQQLINGLPINRRNWIQTDADGNILELRSSLIEAPNVASREMLSRSDASRVAMEAVNDLHRNAPIDADKLVFSSLYYHVLNAELDLAPIYQFNVAVPSGEYYVVRVNGYSGATEIIDERLGIGETVRHRACDKAGNTNYPQNCYGQVPVYTERPDGGYTCYYSGPVAGSPCLKPKYVIPREVIASVNAALETATASNAVPCCWQMGGDDDVVDLVYDVNTQPVPTYLPSGDAILWNYACSGVHCPTEYYLNGDVAAHEFIHAYQKGYNPYLIRTGTNTVERGVAEGMADAVTAIWATSVGGAWNTGQPWIIGDGNPPIGSPRDLTVAKTWNDMDSASEYDKGRVFANFFYRLSQTSAFQGNMPRLLEFALDVTRHATDAGGDGFDIIDWYNALSASVKPGETQIADAVSQVFNAMKASPTAPGGGQELPLPPTAPNPPTAPERPIVLGAQPAAPSCVYVPEWNANASQWQVNFLPSAGAAYYDAYVRSSNGWFYTYIGSSSSATSPPGFVQTTGGGSVYLRACSSLGVCSALSTNSASVSHTLCGF
jgi:hypothetical protein